MDSFDLLSATDVSGRDTFGNYLKLVVGDVIMYNGVAYCAAEFNVPENTGVNIHPCPSCAMYSQPSHIRCPRIECQGNYKNGIVLAKVCDG